MNLKIVVTICFLIFLCNCQESKDEALLNYLKKNYTKNGENLKIIEIRAFTNRDEDSIASGEYLTKAIITNDSDSSEIYLKTSDFYRGKYLSTEKKQEVVPKIYIAKVAINIDTINFYVNTSNEIIYYFPTKDIMKSHKIIK
ncbi:hypothetical protein SAMN05421796_1101 [Chryseobacterium piscicola]|uniref:Uncharacterized protein n=2 Tax=Chryseobacterium piscicola TaxID=551459 RepID=A0A1N7NZ87_9FLAO|nr:hypothetical protein [Chryseobacterium piscicola]SIT03596.1 hypothetical protein SAMN05421796_1101 [Chryseobacterium piscicola]